MAVKKIIKGSDRVLSPVYINKSNGRPHDLTGVTQITACFRAADGTDVQFTLSANEIEIVGNAILGTLKIIMSSTKTALLEAAELADFEVIIDVGAHPSGDRQYVQFLQAVTIIEPNCA